MTQEPLLFSGTEDFSELIKSNSYFVDKTPYLNEIFIKGREKNFMFLRPRRFGKTLNMSMIYEFCKLNFNNPGDKSYQQELFIDNGRNLAIKKDEFNELRETVMGQYPTIFISLKDVKGDCFEDAVFNFATLVGKIFNDFYFLKDSKKLSKQSIFEYLKYLSFFKENASSIYESKTACQIAAGYCGNFLAILGQMLYTEFDRRVLIIIDEYDVPLQKAVVAKTPYYDDMLKIIQQMSSTTFKQMNNSWLYKGIVSGCLKLAHQSVFTDANNFDLFTMDTEPYTGFLGFTKQETLDLLKLCNLQDKESEVKEWYDGYKFGNDHIYNPWSMIKYCKEKLRDKNSKVETYWVNTSGNDIIYLYSQALIQSAEGEIDLLQELIDGKEVEFTLKEFNTYPALKKEFDINDFLTLLLYTGYLTKTSKSFSNNKISAKIPNKEIYKCFEDKFKSLYSKSNQEWFKKAKELLAKLMNADSDGSREIIATLLNQFISIRNTGAESYYHGFMLGILSLVSPYLEEEIESGNGYSDIILKDNITKTAVILEFKKAPKDEDCYEIAKKGVEQIITKNYRQSLINKRFRKIYGFGIGFYGKDCEVICTDNLAENQYK